MATVTNWVEHLTASEVAGQIYPYVGTEWLWLTIAVVFWLWWHVATAAGESEEAAVAYFKLESSNSQEILDSLSSSIELSRVREIIQMYCLALTGHPVEVQASQQLAEKNIGWFQGELPTTEGTTIYMPTVINRYASKDENFGFFKVISTHQIGHIEFGSFTFDFNIPTEDRDHLINQLFSSSV